MTTVDSLLKLHTNEQIITEIERLYPLDSDPELYQAALLELRMIEPTPLDPPWKLVLKTVSAIEEGDEAYIDVVGFRGNETEAYAIDFHPWDQILSMTVDEATVTTLAEIIWEITFHGFSNDTVQKKWAELMLTLRQVIPE
jgi:hypothetical protein